jgi:hypothetical protein
MMTYRLKCAGGKTEGQATELKAVLEIKYDFTAEIIGKLKVKAYGYLKCIPKLAFGADVLEYAHEEALPVNGSLRR